MEVVTRGVLSAQCTDARVNQVQRSCINIDPRLEDIAAASQEEIEREIYTTGFYHNKARNLPCLCTGVIASLWRHRAG